MMYWLLNKQKNLKYILFITLITILLIVYYLRTNISLTTHQLDRNKQNVSKHIKIQSFKSQIHPQDGKNTHYLLTSPSLLINKETNTAHLTNPKLLIYLNDQLSWEITAHQGRMNFTPNDWSNIKKIKLITQVNILQLLGANPIAISSQELEVYPESSLVIGKKKIILNQNKLNTTGIGLHADLKTHSMTLLNNVYTHYLPN